MKIKGKDINKEIRFKGKLIRFFFPYFTFKKFKIANKLIDKFLKRRFKNKNLEVEELFLKKDSSFIRVLIVKKKNVILKDNLSCLFWIHGGGFAIGTPEQDFYYLDYLLNDHSIGIMIDYTLSIVSPYPKALNEIYFVYKYFLDNYFKFNLNKNSFHLGGTSAGGGLVIALTLKLIKNKELLPKSILALYPMISYFDTNSNTNNDAPIWNTKSNKLAWELYKNKNLEIDEYFSPSLANDLSNFPKFISIVGSIDPFCDEVNEFIEKLKKENKEVYFKIYKGCFHAFDYLFKKSNVGKDAKEFIKDKFML